MSFFCIGHNSFDRTECTFMIALYWAFIYIIVIDIVSSLYLSNFLSYYYKLPKKNTVTTDTSGQTQGTDISSGQQVTVDVSGTNTVTNITYYKFDKKTTKYILKMIGIFNLILTITVLLICFKFYSLVIR